MWLDRFFVIYKILNKLGCIFMLVGGIAVGCSSVPNFKPTRPPEEASSFQEALNLCGEYQIKGEQNGSGYPKPSRVAVLTPWLRCFEKVLSKFPEARMHRSFVALFRAMNNKYQSANPADAEIIHWPLMNLAVQSSLEHLQFEHRSFSKEQREAIEKSLPQYAIFLADNGDFGAPTQEFTVEQQDPELRRVSEEIKKDSRFKSNSKAVPRPLPLNTSQKEYCKRYQNLRNLIYDVKDLERYRYVLQNKTDANAGNKREKEMLEHIDDRFRSLKRETLQEHLALKKELIDLKQSSKWFENKHCL